MLALWKKSYDQPRQHIKKQRHYFANILELLNKTGLKDGSDYCYRKSLGEYIDDLDSKGSLNTIGGTIHMFSNLDLRDEFNTLFVSSGINVKKVNLCEENLEEFFTRIVSNT